MSELHCISFLDVSSHYYHLHRLPSPSRYQKSVIKDSDHSDSTVLVNTNSYIRLIDLPISHNRNTSLVFISLPLLLQNTLTPEPLDLQ